MRSSDGGRSLRRLTLAACCALGIGQPLWAFPLDPGVQTCLESLKTVDSEARLLCLRKLEAATPALCDLLARSDGATDHQLVASVLDVFRSLGPRAAPAAETLSGLLPHRHRLYKDRDKWLVIRLRAYIAVTLSEIGFPSSAVPALLDTLAHADEQMIAMEIGAAARAVGSLGPRGRELVPYLLDTLTLRISEEEFSLERYAPQFPPDEATTVQLEAVRSLSRIASAEDREVLTALRQLAEGQGQSEPDPRVTREARRALDILQRKHGGRQ